MERVGGGPQTLESFADMHDLEMRVVERPQPPRWAGSGGALPKYYAHFRHVEIVSGGMLISSAGNGATPDEAIADYARVIAGQRLVYRAGTPERREFQAPNEWSKP